MFLSVRFGLDAPELRSILTEIYSIRSLEVEGLWKGPNKPV